MINQSLYRSVLCLLVLVASWSVLTAQVKGSCYEESGVDLLFACPGDEFCSSWNDGCNDCGCSGLNATPFCTFKICPWCNNADNNHNISNIDCLPSCKDNKACIPIALANLDPETLFPTANISNVTIDIGNINTDNNTATNMGSINNSNSSNSDIDVDVYVTTETSRLPSSSAMSNCGRKSARAASSYIFIAFIAIIIPFWMIGIPAAEASSPRPVKAHYKNLSQKNPAVKLPFFTSTKGQILQNYSEQHSAAAAIPLRGGGEGDKNDSSNNIHYPDSLEELEELLQPRSSDVDGNNDKLIVIDFYANDCAPCEKIAPLYEELSVSDEFHKKVIFVKINVGEQPEIAKKYGVTGWPTFLFIRNGRVMTEIVGGKLAEATLYDWIKLFTSKQKPTSTKEDPEE